MYQLFLPVLWLDSTKLNESTYRYYVPVLWGPFGDIRAAIWTPLIRDNPLQSGS